MTLNRYKFEFSKLCTRDIRQMAPTSAVI